MRDELLVPLVLALLLVAATVTAWGAWVWWTDRRARRRFQAREAYLAQVRQDIARWQQDSARARQGADREH